MPELLQTIPLGSHELLTLRGLAATLVRLEGLDPREAWGQAALMLYDEQITGVLEGDAEILVQRTLGSEWILAVRDGQPVLIEQSLD